MIPWTVACQALLPMGFPRQEYWSGLPFPSPGDLLNPGTEPASPALAGELFITEPPGTPVLYSIINVNRMFSFSIYIAWTQVWIINAQLIL